MIDRYGTLFHGKGKGPKDLIKFKQICIENGKKRIAKNAIKFAAMPFDELTPTRKFKRVREEQKCCEICQLDTWCDKPIPLEIDHINGNNKDNDRSNLRLICANCHAQTSTYRGRNKRLKRLEREAL